MKKYVKNADGIDPKTIYTPETIDDIPAFSALFKAQLDIAKRWTYADAIAMMDEHAAEIISKKNKEDPEYKGEEDLKYEDAQAVAFSCRMLRTHIEAQDIEQVASEAIVLGRAYERMQMRKHEAKVIRVNTTTRKLREGFATEKGHNPEDIASAISLYKKYLKDFPGSKKTTIQKRVEEETGIPWRTIYHHIMKQKKLQ